MRFIIRWTGKMPGNRRGPRLARLDNLLQQAGRSGYYRKRQAMLPERGPRAEEHVGPCLEAVPRVTLREFLTQPVEFFNWHHQPRPLRALECPLGPIGRTALLVDGFEETPHARAFTYHTLDELEEFEPDSLAGPVSKLVNLAEAVVEGRLRMPSLGSALLAFTGLKFGYLTAEDRDLLWRAFQVPVFEQFRGFSQELLAWECEAHDGLHIQGENAIFETGRDGELVLTALGCEEYSLLRVGIEMTAEVEEGACGCGNLAPRLVGLRSVGARMPVARGKAMAAHA